MKRILGLFLAITALPAAPALAGDGACYLEARALARSVCRSLYEYCDSGRLSRVMAGDAADANPVSAYEIRFSTRRKARAEFDVEWLGLPDSADCAGVLSVASVRSEGAKPAGPPQTCSELAGKVAQAYLRATPGGLPEGTALRVRRCDADANVGVTRNYCVDLPQDTDFVGSLKVRLKSVEDSCSFLEISRLGVG